MNPYDSQIPESKGAVSGSDRYRRTDGKHVRTLLAVALAVLFTPALVLYIVVRPAYDRATLSKITPGMTKAQVTTVMGAPQSTEGTQQWEYWRWGNAGWVEIAFDSVDNVTWVNDESVFPETSN